MSLFNFVLILATETSKSKYRLNSNKDTIRKICVRVFRTHNYTTLQGSIAKWTLNLKALTTLSLI